MTKRLETAVRQEQIAKATLRLIMSKGGGALTVKNIAEAVGVSAPALYRHYKNKTAILSAVIDHLQQIYADNLRQVEANPNDPISQIKTIYDVHMDLIKRYNGMTLFFQSDALLFEDPLLRERIQKELSAFEKDIVQLLIAGQRMGLVRNDLPHREMFLLLLCQISSIGSIYSREIVPLDLDRQASTNWHCFESFIRISNPGK